jgi:hypothetical protein
MRRAPKSKSEIRNPKSEIRNPQSDMLPDSLAARIYAEIRDRLPRLPLSHDPGGAVEETLRKLEVSDEELLGRPVRDPLMARAVRSGLLLRADLNDESHTVSQSLKTTEGSYWHGIMHRREPDYSNSKYWFRHVGSHPLFAALGDQVGAACAGEPLFSRLVVKGTWDPFAFVDLCASCEQGPHESLRERLEDLQAIEIDGLLDYCARAARG